ncbi:MAG: hypothetical protein HW387_1742 [Parachlamydiales bacterium]|nr:hypothetical protein [Parachlamydiales bacterium]
MDFVLPDFTWETFKESSSERYGSFLCNVFDEWIKDNNPEISVRILEAIIRILCGKTSAILGVGPRTESNLLVLTIASNGDLSPEETTAHANPDEFMNIAKLKTHR